MTQPKGLKKQKTAKPVTCLPFEWPTTATIFGPFENDGPELDAATLSKIPKSLRIGASCQKAKPVAIQSTSINLQNAFGGVPKEGRIAYAFFNVESPEEMETTIGCGADWRMQWWVNGQPAFDTLSRGNGSMDFTAKAHKFKASLKKGANCLVAKVCSGSNGFSLAAGGPGEVDEFDDWRLLSNGKVIPTKSYSDQPFMVKADDGAWVCCVTTGAGEEGAPGQHVATKRSFDKGQTWVDQAEVESPDGPESSYAVMLKAPSGRIFVFYNHNTDMVPEVKRHDGEPPYKRVDSLGHFVFKFSDDNGKSWSKKRYDIPFRLFDCDRQNVYGGSICFFWNVGRAFNIGSDTYVPLIKVGKMGRGFFAQSEGALLRSPDLLKVKDLSKATWETLPEGETGLRTPPGGGPISEEQSYTVLSDKSIYVTYRSIDGHPVEAYSRDGGRHWTEPRYMQYPDGRPVKHPRAANFVWRCENGKFIYWFHNHGGKLLGSKPNACEISYEDRNPVWMLGGVEVDSPEGKIIRWGQPEILLYDDDPFIRISYPDLLEDGGEYYITETQKATARVHKIPSYFLKRIWDAAEGTPVQAHIPLLEIENAPSTIKAPPLPHLFARDNKSSDYRGYHTRNGFAFELLLKPDPKAGILIDGMDAEGRGFRLALSRDGRLELLMGDGQSESRSLSEPLLKRGRKNHLVVNVDGGPGIVSFISNGRFCDGGEDSQFGWSRYNPFLKHVSFATDWEIAPCVKSLKVHGRPLLSAEAIAVNAKQN